MSGRNKRKKTVIASVKDSLEIQHKTPGDSTDAPEDQEDSDAVKLGDSEKVAKAKREAWQFNVDTTVKLLQMLALVASGIWAIERYREEHAQDRFQKEQELRQANNNRRLELAQREREFRMKFYEEQRPVYLEVCTTAAEITAAKKFADVEEPLTRFRVLHFGQMCLVEDQQVLAAMVYFMKGLEDELGKVEGPTSDLRNRSVLLARACRSSLDLGKVFDVDVQLDDKSLLTDSTDSYTF